MKARLGSTIMTFGGGLLIIASGAFAMADKSLEAVIAMGLGVLLMGFGMVSYER